MSATWNPDDGRVYLGHMFEHGQKPSKDMEAEIGLALTTIECMFDEHTEQLAAHLEVQAIRKKEIHKKLKKLYLMRVLLSPVELPLLMLLFGRKIAAEKFRMLKCMVSALLGRSTVEDVMRLSEHSEKRIAGGL